MDNETLADALSDKTEELSTLERNVTRERATQELRIKTAQQALEELRVDFDSKMQALEDVQRRLSEKERENEELEKEVIRAKAQSGDLETLSIVKRELTEQVNYIKTMETANRKLKEDLKAFQEHRKNLDILEEEKAALEQKVKHMETLQNELAEAQTQVAIFTDQKKSWTAFLEGQNIEFQTPEDLARAFMKERIEHLALLEKQGRSVPEILEKDKEIERLEQENSEMKARLEKYSEGTKKLQSSRQTVERNRRHALREVEFLREQLVRHYFHFCWSTTDLLSRSLISQKKQWWSIHPS
jgi:mitotic spindle assembly checkpoint protein MAD1